MNPIVRLAGAAVLVLAVSGAVFLAFPPVSDVGPPGQTPGQTTASTRLPSTPPEMAGPLVAGTYLGPTLQVADIVAAVNADSTLTQADRDRIIDVYLEIRGKTTWSVSIEFTGALMTERQAVDGVFDVGSFGTWAFPDEQTLVYTERLDGKEVVTEFDITIDGDSFMLHRTTPADDAAGEFVTRVIFESGPFTLE